jgi:4-hydroxy-tetrahydrodipicolinate synthase
MSPATVARLSKFDSIVGIKEASGSLTQVSEIIEHCPSRFTVLSGEDALTFPMLALGAKGAVSVTANLFPKKCAEMIEAALRGDWERAKKIHYELAPINRVLFIETNPVPVKTALGLMKKCSEEVRLPLAPLTAASLEELKKVLKHDGLI